MPKEDSWKSYLPLMQALDPVDDAPGVILLDEVKPGVRGARLDTDELLISERTLWFQYESPSVYSVHIADSDGSDSVIGTLHLA